MGFKVLHWGFRCFSDTERKNTSKCIYASSFLVGKHREPQSIDAKLFLPIIPIGIVAYAFTLLWYNLCRNSCISIQIEAVVLVILQISVWNLGNISQIFQFYLGHVQSRLDQWNANKTTWWIRNRWQPEFNNQKSSSSTLSELQRIKQTVWIYKTGLLKVWNTLF